MYKKFLLIISSLIISVNGLLAEKQIAVKDVAELIIKEPHSISEIDISYILDEIDVNDIYALNNVIQYINPNSIRRSYLKKYYLPLCVGLIRKWVEHSEMLQRISEGHSFFYKKFLKQNTEVAGRDIHQLYNKYKIILSTISVLPKEYIDFPKYYGDIRYLEELLYEKTTFIDKIDPMPKALLGAIDGILDFHTGNRLDDFINTMISHKQAQDLDFFIKHSKTILTYSTYTSSELAIVSIVVETFLNVGKKNDILDLYIAIIKERWGEDYVKKLLPVMMFELNGLLNSDEERRFFEYQDSLLSEGKEYAKYLPHECPIELRKDEGFEDYNNRYYDFLSLIFDVLQVEYRPNSMFSYDFFNKIGCVDKNDFISLYVSETLIRYYDDFTLSNLDKIEELYLYLKHTLVAPLDAIIDIAHVYLLLNTKKASDLLRKTGIVNKIEKEMMSETEVSSGFLYLISATAVIYAALYDNLEYPRIKEYIKYVEYHLKNNYSDSDGIVYEIASALYFIGEYKESNKWIKKIDVEKSEYRIELLRLLLDNNYYLGNRKEVIKLASQLKSLSSIRNVKVLNSMMSEHSEIEFEEYVDAFTKSLVSDFNQFIYMDADDQDWSYRTIKNRISKNLKVGCLNIDKKGLKKASHSFYYPYFSAVLYNWALASKGSLLRSIKQVQSVITEKISEKDKKYYKNALEYEPEDSSDDNMEHSVNSYVSETAKKMILNFIRTDTTLRYSDFDYKKVKENLNDREVAIEVVGLSKEYYVVVLLRKEWDYPKYVNLNINDIKDNIYECFWSPIEKYLKEGEKIYFSLDGIFNTINVELATDSFGTVLADKYELFRVSSTSNLCDDLYISDVKNAVLYGDLKYSEGYSENRGAVIDRWYELPDTKEEIDNIKNVLESNGIDCKVFQREEGDKLSFYEQSGLDIGIFHLATHGFYMPQEYNDNNDVSPMKRAGIVLAGSDLDYYYRKKSGTVFANEISKLDLNGVKLMVLSACETALGELSDDGIIGLQRALKQAGVGTLIMSLKKVNSRTTMILMSEFYNLFVNEKCNVRDAFRKAQKKAATECNNDDWKEFIILD